MEKPTWGTKAKAGHRQGRPEATSPLTGGQGVHREVESEGHEEKYRAVVDGGHPVTNRSAKGGARSSPHYGGEGVSHPPTVARCLRTARYRRPERDPRRTRLVLGWHREKRPYKRKRSGKRRRSSRRTT